VKVRVGAAHIVDRQDVAADFASRCIRRSRATLHRARYGTFGSGGALAPRPSPGRTASRPARLDICGGWPPLWSPVVSGWPDPSRCQRASLVLVFRRRVMKAVLGRWSAGCGGARGPWVRVWPRDAGVTWAQCITAALGRHVQHAPHNPPTLPVTLLRAGIGDVCRSWCDVTPTLGPPCSSPDLTVRANASSTC
jgi:hypothetical protein